MTLVNDVGASEESSSETGTSWISPWPPLLLLLLVLATHPLPLPMLLLLLLLLSSLLSTPGTGCGAPFASPERDDVGIGRGQQVVEDGRGVHLLLDKSDELWQVAHEAWKSTAQGQEEPR